LSAILFCATPIIFFWPLFIYKYLQLKRLYRFLCLFLLFISRYRSLSLSLFVSLSLSLPHFLSPSGTPNHTHPSTSIIEHPDYTARRRPELLEPQPAPQLKPGRAGLATSHRSSY